MQLIYLDNNATTQPDPQVVAAMAHSLSEAWGNPSSTHRFGQAARKEIDDARAAVAKLLGCHDQEVFFTGSGTESTNTAIRGLLASRTPRRRIITSTVEHSATRETCGTLGREGFEIVEIPVDREGLIDVAKFEAALNDDVALVTLMWANNETGVLFPIEKLAPLCKAKRIPIHIDATQTIGKLPVNFAELGIDAATVSAHKFHGPKGIGVLFTRRGVRLRPHIIGGPQERGRRGGTENVSGIVGMGAASKLALEHLADMPRVRALRDRFENTVLERIPETRVNGSREHRLPNTSNLSFARVSAEGILILLSEQGVCASAGAACSSGSLEPSHVIKSMQVDPIYAHGAIRFSFGRYNTDADVDRAIDVLPGVIERLRKVLPVG